MVKIVNGQLQLAGAPVYLKVIQSDMPCSRTTQRGAERSKQSSTSIRACYQLQITYLHFVSETRLMQRRNAAVDP